MIFVMWIQQKEVTGYKAAKYCGKTVDFHQTKLDLNAGSNTSYVPWTGCLHKLSFDFFHMYNRDNNKYLPDKVFLKINFYTF